MNRPRSTSRALERAAESLSDRDQMLLRLLETSRFATTKQLARFHRAGYATEASALRQTSRALRALTELQLVEHLERRIGGRRTGSTGLIWTLTPRGHRLLDLCTGRSSNRRYRTEEEPSTAFLEHTLAVTETHLILFELDASEQAQLLAFEREPVSWRRYLDRSGSVIRLRTDAYAEITVAEYRDSYFLEVDRATEAPVVVERKCLQYQDYRRTAVEQKAHGVFPAVLWLTPTERRATQLRTRLLEDPGITRGLFTVIPIDQLAARILAGPDTSGP